MYVRDTPGYIQGDRRKRTDIKLAYEVIHRLEIYSGVICELWHPAPGVSEKPTPALEVRKAGEHCQRG